MLFLPERILEPTVRRLKICTVKCISTLHNNILIHNLQGKRTLKHSVI